jgi:hypothetical protein
MADDASSSVPPPVVVRNEFSLVELSYVRDGDATALVVADADSGDRARVVPPAAAGDRRPPGQPRVTSGRW